MNFRKKAINWWHFLPKTYLLIIAESFLTAQSGSLQKWLTKHITKELFLKQNSQTCYTASLAWKEKFPPNSQWGGWRQVLGSLVCLNHLLAVTNLQQAPNLSDKCVTAEGPCRPSERATPARGPRGQRSVVPAHFGKEPTWPCTSPAEEEGARLSSSRKVGRQGTRCVAVIWDDRGDIAGYYI